MRRKLLPFVCLLVGLYVGLGLVLRGVTNHDKHTADIDSLIQNALKMEAPPLLLAVEQHDPKEVARLLQTGADPDGPDRGMRRPLLIAARECNLEMVKQLVAAGAAIDSQDRTGTTPLLYAIKIGRSPAVIAFLLASGADAAHKDHAGESPLLMACDSADIGLMEALLAHGADVNDPDRAGLTPLMRVARGMASDNYRRNPLKDPNLLRQNAMQLLLQHGADIHQHDKAGWTALLYASENEPSTGMQVLLKHGADPNTAVKGRTPLRNAAYRGLVGNLQALLAAGVKASPDDFSDALMQASLTGHDGAVQFLLDHGASVNFCDQYGMTPLMLAIANDHMSTGKVLVQRGADTRMRDLLGKTAIDYALPGRNGVIHVEVFGDLSLRRF